MKTQSALKQYQSINTEGNVADADPHRLIQMLMEGALEKVGKAKAFMAENMIEEKSKHISWAISIISGLKESLDFEKGGEIATNLDRLYDFMVRHLMQANLENSIEKLDVVIKILHEIKEGWDGIREQVVQTPEKTDKPAPEAE